MHTKHICYSHPYECDQAQLGILCMNHGGSRAFGLGEQRSKVTPGKKEKGKKLHNDKKWKPNHEGVPG